MCNELESHVRPNKMIRYDYKFGGRINNVKCGKHNPLVTRQVL